MKIKKAFALTLTIAMFSGMITGCSESDSISLSSQSEGSASLKTNININEESEMEIYKTAVQLYDTWITGRMEENQMKAESVLYPDEKLREGDSYSAIKRYNSYELIQFLVTDVSEDIIAYNEDDSEDFLDGVNIQEAYQLNSQNRLYASDNSSEWDTCTDCIIKIDDKWYFYPDVSFRDIDPCEIGFSVPTIKVFGFEGSGYTNEQGEYVEESYFYLADGSKISEKEYEASKIIKYGYSVEKDNTFHFYPIQKDGTVIFEDGKIAIVSDCTRTFVNNTT